MEERQTNFTIAEGGKLPSLGLIYDKQINPDIEMRSMTGRDEMKRKNGSNTPFKTLADILEGCLIEKPAVHVYDMALGDYEYLLFKSRIITYGEEMKLAVRCPWCGKETEGIGHLDELEVKEFNADEYDSFRTFSLPKSGKLVSLNFQTPRTLDTIASKVKEMQRKYPDAEIDFETMITLQLAIDTVEGDKLGNLELENFINKLPAADIVKILNNLEKLNDLVGLKNETFITCQHCNNDIKTFFRIGPEFFRPTNI